MRAIVTGAKGQLGRALAEILGERGHEVLPLSRSVDIADPSRLSVAVGDGFDVLFNAAAATDVDRCEREPEWAFRVNAEGPGFLGELCRQAGAHLVHVSTDFVFSGRVSRPYREDDAPDPQSVYGQSKLLGEKRALDACPGAFVARTSWVFGVTGRNFLHAVLDRAARGEPVRAAADQVGSPTYAADLAEALVTSVERGLSGLYHVANEGAASRYALAQAALRAADLGSHELIEAKLSDFPAEATRPLRTALDCRAAAAEGLRLRPWEEAVAAFVRRLSVQSDPLAAGLPASQSVGVRCDD
ncbi:MAG: dTDP-4-dehydrorhamnose reductase [Myxococcales bacterium]|nr:dTDP-4-dehydrorhamnose reductase [Myxococcales bacterium]